MSHVLDAALARARGFATFTAFVNEVERFAAVNVVASEVIFCQSNDNPRLKTALNWLASDIWRWMRDLAAEEEIDDLVRSAWNSIWRTYCWNVHRYEKVVEERNKAGSVSYSISLSEPKGALLTHEKKSFNVMLLTAGLSRVAAAVNLGEELKEALAMLLAVVLDWWQYEFEQQQPEVDPAVENR